MAKSIALALFNHQRSDQATPQLLAAGGMRVIPETAGIRADEVVVKVLTRPHRQLRDVGHAVHVDRQADTMPVNSGRLAQLVDEAHPQAITLAATQLDTRCLAAIGP